MVLVWPKLKEKPFVVNLPLACIQDAEKTRENMVYGPSPDHSDTVIINPTVQRLTGPKSYQNIPLHHNKQSDFYVTVTSVTNLHYNAVSHDKTQI